MHSMAAQAVAFFDARLTLPEPSSNPLLSVDDGVGIIRVHGPLIVGNSATGFADQHPGTAITALANFQSSVHGFSPTEGKIIYKDPTRELSDTDEPQVSFTAEMFPGIAP